jgi:hypothetical protein
MNVGFSPCGMLLGKFAFNLPFSRSFFQPSVSDQVYRLSAEGWGLKA